MDAVSHNELDIYITYWWYFLMSLAIFNLIQLLYQFTSRKFNTAYKRLLLLFGFFYVFGCGFRSFLLRRDIERICMFDYKLSAVFYGRSAATIAEVSYGASLGLVLHHITQDVANSSTKYRTSTFYPITTFVSYLVFILVFVANVNCWIAVLTTMQLFHAIEESLWAIAAALMIPCAIILLYHMNIVKQQKLKDGKVLTNNDAAKFLYGVVILGFFYFLYMIFVDVPMYWNRWVEDNSNINEPKTYLTLAEGFNDIFTCKLETSSYEVWHEEIIWMSGYFSCAVWSSIWLLRAPSFIFTSKNSILAAATSSINNNKKKKNQ